MFGKSYTPPKGVVHPDIPAAVGPSIQPNELDGQKFFTKTSEWFNKVPFPQEYQDVGVAKVLAGVGIVQGQKFNYDSLSPEQKRHFDVAAKGVQRNLQR
jgi:hypothetical protein